KSTFAASLADAGLGKLCLFDTELKATHLPGSDGTRFDAYELADPHELEPAIDWALHDPDGQAQHYGCYALDSFNGWFAPTYAEFLNAKREETGAPYPELDGADLQRLQVVCGEILRPLCVDSKACVVITDTIAGKGLEEKADNEVGRIVPISASGLEYFVDVLVESELRIGDDGISETCIHRVIKTNTRAFPIGLVLEQPTFADYLSRLGSATVATAATIKAETIDLDGIPMFSVVEPAEPSAQTLLAQLLEKVERYGFTRENVVTVANRDYGKPVLTELTAVEIVAIEQRIEAAAQKRGTHDAPVAAPARTGTRGKG
ncbi:MAG TPA: hypothetical protein VHB98_07790, partial [Chloroflexota bacterium]|nr:hypothetical protein [Chloroflexota bacterium]